MYNNQQQRGWVPVPNQFFDEVILLLGDTELRVLLVVMRSTLGWREGSNLGGTQAKRRDWISHAQMMRRTGRSSASISSAVAKLVEASMIVVETERGESLQTPEERRAYLGKQYFGLGDKWITQQPSHPQKVRTTTYTEYNIQRQSQRNPVDNSRFGGLTQVSSLLKDRPPYPN
ncbi:MAG: replication protein [Chthonomonadales bacterium]